MEGWVARKVLGKGTADKIKISSLGLELNVFIFRILSQLSQKERFKRHSHMALSGDLLV